MELQTLYTAKDILLNVSYKTVRTNALELSNYLKSNLQEKGIDYNSYNSAFSIKKNSWDDDNTETEVPTEIYEYQNFFLLLKDGEYYLLDGFRRLLWYTAPDIDINVRIYDYKDLSDKDVLSLMVNLNHFKFYAYSNYYDRGFALLLRTLYSININLFFSQFNTYMTSDMVKNSYYLSENKTQETKLNDVKSKIITDHFITDMQFLEKMANADIMFDRFVSTIIYQRSSQSQNIDFDTFYGKVKASDILMELISKWKNIGTDRSAKSQDVVNKILEMYNNIFDEMNNIEVELSYAEKLDLYKKEVTRLKKVKNLQKLSGTTSPHIIEREILTAFKDKTPITAIIVFKPLEKKEERWGNDVAREFMGFEVIEVELKYKGYSDHLMTRTHKFGFMYNNVEFRLEKGWSSSSRKYTKI